MGAGGVLHAARPLYPPRASNPYPLMATRHRRRRWSWACRQASRCFTQWATWCVPQPHGRRGTFHSPNPPPPCPDVPRPCPPPPLLFTSIWHAPYTLPGTPLAPTMCPPSRGACSPHPPYAPPDPPRRAQLSCSRASAACVTARLRLMSQRGCRTGRDNAGRRVRGIRGAGEGVSLHWDERVGSDKCLLHAEGTASTLRNARLRPRPPPLLGLPHTA